MHWCVGGGFGAFLFNILLFIAIINLGGQLGRFRYLKIIFAVVLLLLAFQNCSDKAFTSNSTSDSNTNSELSGNGGGYTGKPDGDYYRFPEVSQCESKVFTKEIVKIDGTNITFTSNNNVSCSQETINLDSSKVSFSPFQSEFIVANNFVFKKFNTYINNKPEILPEVLCRDNFDNPEIEIITHFNSTTSQALFRIYQQIQNEELEKDTPISRLYSNSQLSYDSNQVSLMIDTVSVDSQGKLDAIYTIKGSVQAPLNLHCVLGGGIQKRSWSFKATSSVQTDSYLNFKDNIFVIGFEFLSQLKSIFFPFSFYAIVNDSAIDLGIKNFPASSSALRIDPLLFSNNEFLVTMVQNTGVKSLYLFTPNMSDQNLSKFTQLTNVNTTSESVDYNRQMVGNYAAISSNGNIIFEVTSSYTPKLRFYDQITKTFSTLSNDYTGISLYRMMPNKNKLFYTDSNGAFIYDLNTKVNKFILRGKYMVDTCYLNGFYARVVNNEEDVLFGMTCADNLRKIMKVSTSTYEIQEIVSGKSVYWESIDQQWLGLIESTSNFSQIKLSLYSIKENKEYSPDFAFENFPFPLQSSYIQAARDKNLFSYNLGESIYVIANDLNNADLYRFNLSSKVFNKICDNVQGKKIALGNLNKTETYLFTYDSILKTYFYYRVTQDQCKIVNQFFSEKFYIQSFEPSTYGFGLVLDTQGISSTSVGKLSSDVYFTPVDGSPSLKINPTGLSLSNFKKIEFTDNGKKLLIHGMLANDSSNKLYIFDLEKK